MIGINDLVEELADDVFIRQFKSMDNNELSIEQQQEEDRGEDETLIEAVTELLWAILYVMMPVERESCC